MLRSVALIILGYIVCVLLCDVAGVLLITILPEPGSYRLNGHAGYGSVALYYTVWLVAGGFAGFFFTVYSLEVVKSDTSLKKNPFIILIIGLILSAGLIYIFYTAGEMRNPRFNFSNNYYVPGHRNVTFTFFISLLLMIFLILSLEKAEKNP